MQPDQEGVTDLGEDLFFSHDVILKSPLNDVFLVENLDGVEFLVLAHTSEDYLGISTSTNL